MKISGHKTRAVFDRYNIVSQSDLIEAARRMENRQSGQFDQSLTRVTEVDETAAAIEVPARLRN